MLIFVGRNRKTSIIRKKQEFSGLSSVSGFGRRKLTQVNFPQFVSLQSTKFPLPRNIKIDNSECYAITTTEKSLKTPKMKVLYFLINVVYFDEQISNPMSIFVGRARKLSIIRKKLGIARHISIAVQIFGFNLRRDPPKKSYMSRKTTKKIQAVKG